MEIFAFLTGLGIAYLRFDHEPVYTCEDANLLNPDIPGIKTKNLFLRDRKGKRHFLLVVRDDKNVDLTLLSEQLAVNRLALASAERLATYLATQPGSVSILDVIHDPESRVELVIDQDVWRAEELQCHPFVNTSTLVISLADMRRLLQELGRGVSIIDVPLRLD